MNWDRFLAANYRGVLIPRVLGLLVAAGVVLVAVPAFVVGGSSDAGRVVSSGWVALAACFLVLMAGLVDDLLPIGPRGLRGHLRSLASGQMTTGILKTFVIGAAAIVTIVSLGARAFPVEISGIFLISAAANLWNGFDVRPGRALKVFVVVAVSVLVTVAPWRVEAIVGGALLGALIALPLDLLERAMLGDSGANLLGFVAGVGLYVVLPGWGVALCSVAAVTLNLLAETITLSRLIQAFPPLRWLDGLGRIGPRT